MEMDMKKFQLYLGFALGRLNYGGFYVRPMVMPNFCHDVVIVLMAQFQLTKINWSVIRLALLMVIMSPEIMDELYIKI